MSPATLEKRITALERRIASLLCNAELNFQLEQLVGQTTIAGLNELKRQTLVLKKKVESVGDYRTALACVRVIRDFLELEAKLHGELQETSRTSVMNVNLDPETASKIAQTYLARRKLLEGTLR